MPTNLTSVSYPFRIFVSYSREDAAFAEMIITELTERGLKLLYFHWLLALCLGKSEALLSGFNSQRLRLIIEI
jgi:excinuclease UvrABC ATPase subunit